MELAIFKKRIFQKYNCDTSFLDISQAALEYTKRNVSNLKDKSKLHFIEMSALNMGIKDNSYDIVWNAGVIEHFEKEDQKKMISEMFRITKKGGFVILFTPSTCGKIYLKMKKRAEKLGTWQTGYEKPISTISNITDDEYEETLNEFSRGFVTQMHYLKYICKNKFARYVASFFLEILQYLLSPLEKLPGYYLVSVIEKK